MVSRSCPQVKACFLLDVDHKAQQGSADQRRRGCQCPEQQPPSSPISLGAEECPYRTAHTHNVPNSAHQLVHGTMHEYADSKKGPNTKIQYSVTSLCMPLRGV